MNNTNAMTSFPYLIESKATLRQLSEWKDQQLQHQQQHVIDPTNISNNDSNHRHPTTTTFRRDSFSSTSSCATVSTEQLSDTSSLSLLDDTSFDESCSLSSSSSSTTSSVARGSNNDNDSNSNNQSNNQQQQQQQQRRRRRRRSKNNNNNNNNKLVGRRVTVPTNKNNSNSRRFSSSLPTTNTTTPPTITEEEKNKYIAMDCEMVGIGPYGATSRLARVVLVNYDGCVLYDVHVQVTEVITDYRTHVSGILPSDLLPSNGAVSFTQARSTVQSLIHNKILIGHGLKSDFAALYIHDHPWYNIRDTAKYEPFMRQLKHQPQQHQQPDNDHQDNSNNSMMTPLPLVVVLVPKKLKTLAYDKLGIVIQRDGLAHSPIEDAFAAMELYKRHCSKWERVVQYKLDRTKEIMDN